MLEHTLFVITTESLGNSSHLYTADKVEAMFQRQKEKYGWEFLFPAANIDAGENCGNDGHRP